MVVVMDLAAVQGRLQARQFGISYEQHKQQRTCPFARAKATITSTSTNDWKQAQTKAPCFLSTDIHIQQQSSWLTERTILV
jgi:hypothetical protein